MARHNTITGLVGALAGGAVGLVAMQLIDMVLAPLVRPRAPRPQDVFATERSMSPLGVRHHPDETATDAIARLACEKLVGRAPSPRTKFALSWAIHIAYGLAVAAAYRLARPRAEHPLRDGALFGTALWLVGDELAMPLLGLADKPTMFHPTHHARALVDKIGFAVATTATARVIERKLR